MTKLKRPVRGKELKHAVLVVPSGSAEAAIVDWCETDGEAYASAEGQELNPGESVYVVAVQWQGSWDGES